MKICWLLAPGLLYTVVATSKQQQDDPSQRRLRLRAAALKAQRLAQHLHKQAPEPNQCVVGAFYKVVLFTEGMADEITSPHNAELILCIDQICLNLHHRLPEQLEITSIELITTHDKHHLQVTAGESVVNFMPERRDKDKNVLLCSSMDQLVASDVGVRPGDFKLVVRSRDLPRKKVLSGKLEKTATD